jgi:tmRNA-binding protein
MKWRADVLTITYEISSIVTQTLTMLLATNVKFLILNADELKDLHQQQNEHTHTILPLDLPFIKDKDQDNFLYDPH